MLARGTPRIAFVDSFKCPFHFAKGHRGETRVSFRIRFASSLSIQIAILNRYFDYPSSKGLEGPGQRETPYSREKIKRVSLCLAMCSRKKVDVSLV